jgi:hypothetical protein
MGHERDATLIRIEKRRHMRWLEWHRTKTGPAWDDLKQASVEAWEKSDWPSAYNALKCGRTFGIQLARKLLRLSGVAVDSLFSVTVAYGYKPLRAVLWLLCFWLAFAAYYAWAIPARVMAPTDALVYQSSAIPPECRDDWIDFKPKSRPNDGARREEMSQKLGLLAHDRDDQPFAADWPTICKATMPPEYTTFSPAVYALDLLLPIIDLRQEKDWAPRVTDERGNIVAPIIDGWGWGYVTRIIEWIMILLGWILSALLIGAVTGIIRRD